MDFHEEQISLLNEHWLTQLKLKVLVDIIEEHLSLLGMDKGSLDMYMGTELWLDMASSLCLLDRVLSVWLCRPDRVLSAWLCPLDRVLSALLDMVWLLDTA